jgi:hypothetical protein
MLLLQTLLRHIRHPPIGQHVLTSTPPSSNWPTELCAVRRTLKFLHDLSRRGSQRAQGPHRGHSAHVHTIIQQVDSSNVTRTVELTPVQLASYHSAITSPDLDV